MSDVEYQITESTTPKPASSQEMLVIDTTPKPVETPVEDTPEERLRRAEVTAANLQYIRRLIQLEKRLELRAGMKKNRKERNRAKNKVARQSRKRNR